MGKNIYLVSCVKKKRIHPCPAKDLYISDWFEKASQYASQHADEWFILSAKYFLVYPDQVIETYDLTLKSMKVEERKKWASQVLQILTPLLIPDDRITFLAGELYREFLIPNLAQAGYKISIPMQGLRNGKQLGWLKEKLAGE